MEETEKVSVLEHAVDFQFYRVATKAKEVDVGEWHSQDVSGIPEAVSWEVRNAVFEVPIPGRFEDLQQAIRPSLPWAEVHFQERVGGEPLNPPPSHVDWPWSSANEKHQTQEGEAFSHSYPERFWPKHANLPAHINPPHEGIRFRYGDLGDVVDLLVRSPHTRQAYLPVWFPEDTGVVHGERVPCSLGYHFMLRDEKLNVGYTIRSCDVMRYFRDDVYFACRLGQWVREEARRKLIEEEDYRYELFGEMGTLSFMCYSLHCFAGDLKKIRREYGDHHQD